jgi:hypothetical protein
MFPPEPGQDESNAPSHSEIPLPLSNGSQFPPPEPAHFEVFAADVLAIDASGGVDSPGGAQPRWECFCGQTFGRGQELRRHLVQVDQPRQTCPFKLCTYNWKRLDKIKAHIMNVHASKFCPKLLEEIRNLRGKKMDKFLEQLEVLDAYDLDMLDTYQLPPCQPHLLEAPGASGIYYLRCVPKRENKWIV